MDGGARAAVLAYLSWAKELRRQHPSAGRGAFSALLGALLRGDSTPLLQEASQAEAIVHALEAPPLAVPTACEDLHRRYLATFRSAAELLRTQASVRIGRPHLLDLFANLRQTRRLLDLGRQADEEAARLLGEYR